MSRKYRRTIRAAEISSYLYCKRAWWYTLKGVKTQNEHELVDGRETHHQHGVKVFVSEFLRLVAYILILAALALFTIYLTQRFI